MWGGGGRGVASLNEFFYLRIQVSKAIGGMRGCGGGGGGMGLL